MYNKYDLLGFNNAAIKFRYLFYLKLHEIS